MILQHLKNPFLAIRLSDNKFRKIALTNLQRLKANDQDGAYTSLVDVTQTLYDAYEQVETAEAIELTIRQEKTVTANNAITAIKAFVSRKHGVIGDIFYEDPATFEEFFPHGLTVFRRASKKNIAKLYNTFVAAIQSHATKLDADMVQDAKLLSTAYKNSRELQLEKIGNVKELDTVQDKARYVLGVQLYKNLLTLLLMHAENTKRVIDFFDLSISKTKKKKSS